MINTKINCSIQKKSSLRNTYKLIGESKHLRRKTEKIEPKERLLTMKTYITKPKCVPLAVSKGKEFVNNELQIASDEVMSKAKGEQDKSISCKVLDLSEDIEPIFENDELEIKVAELSQRKPPVFITNKQKEHTTVLLGRIPIFKQNISPKGGDLTSCEIELPKELNKKYDEKRLRVSTTDNSSRCSSDIYMESTDKEQIGPQSFIAHKLLGKGSFGEVYLVQKINSNNFYAMKVIKKKKIMNENLVKYVLTERRVMSEMNHPFIVKLHFAFQSNSRLFLVMDYCPGGDLTDYLRKEKKFTEERAKIYIMEVILALEHLHKKNIIFRDLKPDNVVLDAQGHALLTDFGLSKEGVHDNQGAKSFCGSLSYLAPEMIKRTGHGKSVDWYLLGVLLYEMLIGVPPYYSSNKYKLSIKIGSNCSLIYRGDV